MYVYVLRVCVCVYTWDIGASKYICMYVSVVFKHTFFLKKSGPLYSFKN